MKHVKEMKDEGWRIRETQHRPTGEAARRSLFYVLRAGACGCRIVYIDYITAAYILALFIFMVYRLMAEKAACLKAACLLELLLLLLLRHRRLLSLVEVERPAAERALHLQDLLLLGA